MVSLSLGPHSLPYLFAFAPFTFTPCRLCTYFRAFVDEQLVLPFLEHTFGTFLRFSHCFAACLGRCIYARPASLRIPTSHLPYLPPILPPALLTRMPTAATRAANTLLAPLRALHRIYSPYTAHAVTDWDSTDHYTPPQHARLRFCDAFHTGILAPGWFVTFRALPFTGYGWLYACCGRITLFHSRGARPHPSASHHLHHTHLPIPGHKIPHFHLPFHPINTVPLLHCHHRLLVRLRQRGLTPGRRVAVCSCVSPLPIPRGALAYIFYSHLQTSCYSVHYFRKPAYATHISAC